METANLEQMIQELNRWILPSSLMECFDRYREESVRRVSEAFTGPQLAWFLDMMNRFRGPEDRKDSLLDVFDPSMFTCQHAAWQAVPGTKIEMPALTSDIGLTADRDSRFSEIAREEIRNLRERTETYADEEVLGLAQIATASLADRARRFAAREDALRYLALNASSALEDLCATDDSLWNQAPVRVIEFDDMVAQRKALILDQRPDQSPFREQDFACYSEKEIRKFAFDTRGFFPADRAKHLAICTRCRDRLESWTKLVDTFEYKAATHDGRANA